MEIYVGKIVGRMEGGWWGQIHDFTPEEEEKLVHKGRLVAVVSWKGGEAGTVKIVEEGREILGRLHELYFGGGEEGLAGLCNAVTKLREEFAEVEVEAVVIVGEAVYVAVAGRGGVWVMAGGKEGWIVKPGEKEGVTGLAGRTGEERVMVLGNGRWWERVSLGQVKMAAGGEDMESGWEMLAAAVHGEERAGGEVGAIVKFKTQNTKVKTETEEVVEEKKAEKKASWWERIKEKMPKKPVFVTYEGRGDRLKNRKKIRIIAGGFAIMLLVIGVGGKIKMQNKSKAAVENNQLVEDMVYKFHEAKGVVVLNPQRSRDLLPVVAQELATLEQRKVNDPRMAEVKAEMGDVLGAATGIKKVGLKQVFDLGLIREGMNGDKLAISDGKLVVVDVAGSRVALVDPAKDSGKIIAGSEGIGHVKIAAGYPGKIEVFSDKGVVEVGADGNEAKVQIASDGTWGNIADIKMFTGNIYLLDTGGGDIWRYQANGDGFGKKQDWLADGSAKSALKFGKSMAIDGNIWVAGGGGTLLKFTVGVKEDVAVSGWDKPWGNTPIIYTDDSAQKLYILDRDNGRLVVLNKTGEYEMQLVNDNLKSMEDMVADEANNKAYVVGQGKIWEVDF